MSSNDATKNKLLDTMRISKAGVGETTTTATPVKKAKATKARPKKAATRKAATKKSTTKKPVRKAASKTVASGTFESKHSADVARDSFQSSGRVWPD